MKNYDRHTILRKLSKKGIEPYPSSKNIAYLQIPKNLQVGIKLWGMIDFLKVKWIRGGKHGKKKKY